MPHKPSLANSATRSGTRSPEALRRRCLATPTLVVKLRMWIRLGKVLEGKAVVHIVDVDPVPVERDVKRPASPAIANDVAERLAVMSISSASSTSTSTTSTSASVASASTLVSSPSVPGPGPVGGRRVRRGACRVCWRVWGTCSCKRRMFGFGLQVCGWLVVGVYPLVHRTLLGLLERSCLKCKREDLKR